MFKKILIANRGEIACRVIKTARRLGIETVAVYSSADANALHVRMADTAIHIGEAPASESYLQTDRILEAARRTGAEAIHPGYGFLAENADFAEACQQAGIVFIGPPASAIRAMGSKSASKALMEQAAVPLTPGYFGDNQDSEFLAAEAQRIGFPVLIKASSGGGGKGMRRVDDAAGFEAALASCKREAQNSFGDDLVLIEKYVLQPRHIEIQIFGDTHGQWVYLFERDCSTQRRYQKVLEEAPAPGLTPELRAEMGRAAVEAAKAVNYVGAGTVEFIVHQNGNFYFMEMNTRLQVEHPVTEMITGLDLVEWQLRIANGQAIPLTQGQVTMSGHAIEARIYAENPDMDFLPSTGRLTHLVPPQNTEYIRIDSGVEQGDEITPYYDPMIAKLIVWGQDREQALARLRKALSQYRIVGVHNNIEFLSRLADSPSFTTAKLDTSLIEREHNFLFAPVTTIPREVWLLAALADLLKNRTKSINNNRAYANAPWQTSDTWRLNGRGIHRIPLQFKEEGHTLEATSHGQDWDITLNDQKSRIGGSLDTDGILHARIDDCSINAAVVVSGQLRHIFFEGRGYPVQRLNDLDSGVNAEADGGDLRSPMPGKIIALLASVDTIIDKGKPLLVMEAMKMEHTLTAPTRGMVKKYHCEVGEQVPDGIELIHFEAVEAAS